jgi:hypothetical protein
MSSRHFASTDNAELRAKIDKAKTQLPLPELMRRLGYEEQTIGKTALCPFHDDHNPSFSVFQKNGVWLHKCFVGCSSGDEIAFLVKHFGISRRQAIKRYLDMAGFPASAVRKSREYPKPHVSPESPECPVSHVSEGHRLGSHAFNGELQKELKALAERNACTGNEPPEKHSWQLAREIRAVAKRLDRKLIVVELMQTFDEWHRVSESFLEPKKLREDYWTEFLAHVQKVRVPTGEGAIAEALETVSKLTEAELPIVPGYCNGLKPRKIMALHSELSRRSRNKDKRYFLSYRDAAMVCDGLSHQEAHTITLSLVSVGVIDIVSKGKPGLNSGEAAEFRYLLSQTENGAAEDAGFEL